MTGIAGFPVAEPESLAVAADRCIDYFDAMLADDVRMARYQQALDAVVRPGAVVADVGCGTGVLALMARAAGAGRIYAVERTREALQVARYLASANRAEECIRFVHGTADAVELPEKVDVIVCELLGSFGTDEGMEEALRVFAARNLKPGGVIIPSRLTTWLMPVEHRGELRGAWRRRRRGIDLSPVTELAAGERQRFFHFTRPPRGLAPPVALERVVFGDPAGGRPASVDFSFVVDAPGRMDGFLGWFEAELVPGLTLANHPGYRRCHWPTWNWLVSPARPLAPGDRLEGQLVLARSLHSRGWFIRWQLCPSAR
jgi:SAM-dependent methyltransferase